MNKRAAWTVGTISVLTGLACGALALYGSDGPQEAVETFAAVIAAIAGAMGIGIILLWGGYIDAMTSRPSPIGDTETSLRVHKHVEEARYREANKIDEI